MVPQDTIAMHLELPSTDSITEAVCQLTTLYKARAISALLVKYYLCCDIECEAY